MVRFRENGPMAFFAGRRFIIKASLHKDELYRHLTLKRKRSKIYR